MEILIIGLGKAAWAYAQSDIEKGGITHSYSIKKVRPLAVMVGVDPSQIARESWSGEFDSVSYPSVESLENFDRFDLIVICTPGKLLCDFLLSSISKNNRANILVEKPLINTPFQFTQLSELPSESQSRIFVNLPRLFQPETKVLKDIISQNFSLQPLQLDCTFSGGFFNTGSHFLSLLRYLLDGIDFELNLKGSKPYIDIKSNVLSRYLVVGTLNFEESGPSTGNFRLTSKDSELNYLDGGNVITGHIGGELLKLNSTRSNYQEQVYKDLLNDVNLNLHPSRLDFVLPSLKNMVEIGAELNAGT